MTDSPDNSTFATAANIALGYLSGQCPMTQWMVTRWEGESGVIIASHGKIDDLNVGTVLRWADSLCHGMVHGEGPRFAARLSEIPIYASAPFSKRWGIASYLGAPVQRSDGAMFGTLSAIDRSPQTDSMATQLGLVEVFAELLGQVLRADERVEGLVRLVETREHDATTDTLTGLFNRRGWDERIVAEESRCRRHGRQACVVVVDLNELKSVNDLRGHAGGDDLIRRTADVLKATVRRHDIVARVGGDEFAILGIECNDELARSLHRRLSDALREAGISASLGVANRRPDSNLETTWHEADLAMYQSKRGQGSLS